MTTPQAILGQLLASERAIMDAIRRKDRSALDQLLAPEFVLRAPEAADVSRAEFLAGILAIPGNIESIQGVGTNANVIGDIGVVTGIQEARVRLDAGGAVAISRTAFTDLFRRQDDAWRLVFAFSVEMPVAAES